MTAGQTLTLADGQRLMLEPENDTGLPLRAFRRLPSGHLEYATLLDVAAFGTRARFYGYCSKDLPFEIEEQKP